MYQHISDKNKRVDNSSISDENRYNAYNNIDYYGNDDNTFRVYNNNNAEVLLIMII